MRSSTEEEKKAISKWKKDKRKKKKTLSQVRHSIGLGHRKWRHAVNQTPWSKESFPWHSPYTFPKILVMESSHRNELLRFSSNLGGAAFPLWSLRDSAIDRKRGERQRGNNLFSFVLFSFVFIIISFFPFRHHFLFFLLLFTFVCFFTLAIRWYRKPMLCCLLNVAKIKSKWNDYEYWPQY